MAKDKADQGRTRDFVSGASAAERQRAFAERQRERGYRRHTIWMHERSYNAGRAAGLDYAGEAWPPDDCEDRLAWLAGYLEGFDLRQQHEQGADLRELVREGKHGEE